MKLLVTNPFLGFIKPPKKGSSWYLWEVGMDDQEWGTAGKVGFLGSGSLRRGGETQGGLGMLRPLGQPYLNVCAKEFA